jgi:hypothetical protein
MTAPQRTAHHMARSSLQLGYELQKISDSATWAHYVAFHPGSKVGFCHHNDRLLLTLVSPVNHGVIKYADNADELLEVAHLALWEQGEIEVF